MTVACLVMDRHQLDRRDAEFLQVLDCRLEREALIRAASGFRNPRMQLREAAHMQFVNDRVVPLGARRPIVAPGERRIENGRERCKRRAVPVVEREIALRIPNAVAEHLVGPPNRTRHGFRVWIHDKLVGIESVSSRRIVRTVDPIAVELVRFHVGEEPVPHHVGVLRQFDSGGLLRGIHRVEQTKFHLRRMRREQREVDADARPASA